MKPVQSAIPGAVSELLRGSPMSPGKVDFAWKTAVGTNLQRATAVRLEESILLVDTISGQWAREVMRSSPVILRRLQTLLGAGVVTAIHVRPPASDVKPLPRKTRRQD